MENFDAFRDAARNLIRTDPRYLLQIADGSYYVDRDSNGEFEEDVDVVLLSDPIRHAGVHYAHASGLTGAGQVIAVSDAGYLPSHEVFDGKPLTNQSTSAVDGHGTAVASIASGSSSSMIGVAPGAGLILGDYSTFEALRQTALEAARQDAVALNNSWRLVSLAPTQDNFDNFDAARDTGQYLDALRLYSQEGVVVFAASNDYSEQAAGFMAALPAFDPDLEAGWLSVVNGVPVMVDDDVVAAERVSGGCLEAASWCLAADGSWTSAWSGSDQDYQFGTGTSYAAPVVSGAMALLAEAFPDLTPHDLRIRLLASADNQFEGFTTTATVELLDGFFREISDEWGHGFLDVKAALMPIGQTSIPLADGGLMSMNEPALVGGGVYGDAPVIALAGTGIAVQDALSAQFNIDASSIVASRRPASLIPMDTVHLARTDQADCCALSAFLEETTSVSIPFGDLSLDLNISDTQSGGDTFGLQMTSLNATSWGSLSFSLGVGHDGGSLSIWDATSGNTLVSSGFTMTSAFSDATSLSVGAGVAQFSQNAEDAHSGPIQLTSAMASLEHRNLVQTGDQLSFLVELPAAVSTGQTSLTLPIARAASGSDFEQIEIDLAPDKREVVLGISYDFDISASAFGTFSMRHAVNRGNVSGAVDRGVYFGIGASF